MQTCVWLPHQLWWQSYVLPFLSRFITNYLSQHFQLITKHSILIFGLWILNHHHNKIVITLFQSSILKKAYIMYECRASYCFHHLYQCTDYCCTTSLEVCLITRNFRILLPVSCVEITSHIFLTFPSKCLSPFHPSLSLSYTHFHLNYYCQECNFTVKSDYASGIFHYLLHEQLLWISYTTKFGKHLIISDTVIDLIYV